MSWKPVSLLLRSLCLGFALSQPALAGDAVPGELQAQLARIFAAREFEGKRFGPARWLEKGKAYAVVEPAATVADGKDVVRYDTVTGARSVLVAAASLVPAPGAKPLAIDGYEWSNDGARLLVFTNSKKVWRRNTRGDYWLLDVKAGKLRKLGAADWPESTLMFAKLSPDGRRAAYVHENDLWVEDLDSGKLTRLTADGSATVINGTSDWVDEEEFFLRDGFRWSPNGADIAFWRFDTSGVGRFTLINDTDSLYPVVTTFPYPKAGTTNSEVKIGIVSASGGATRWVSLPGDPRNTYVPRMEWVAGTGELMLQQLNRRQNVDDVWLADAKTGQARRLLHDEDEAWIEIDDSWQWLPGDRELLWVSERDGWRHAWAVSRDSGAMRLLTPGDFDLLSVAGVDESNGLLYFTASPDDATRSYLYQARLDGKGAPQRVTPAGLPGSHTYNLSPDGRYAIHTVSTADSPPVTDLVRLPSHQVVRGLEDNQKLAAAVAPLATPPTEFFQVDGGGGVKLDGWMIKPRRLDPARKYPLLMYVYGEPAGVVVTDSWRGSLQLFFRALADAGYVVAAVDNRGTPAPKGRAWRRSVNGAVGVLATEEQTAAVKSLLAARPYLDAQRVASFGASGGGSMTLNLLFRSPDVYKVGMAVAPVPDQTLYDTIYQERYMGLPVDNAEGYQAGSPINFAAGLKGKLLLVHGSGDDNVHFQGTERLVNRLIALGKPFDLMAYPNRTHALAEGEGTALHLNSLLARYLMENLPAGPRDPSPPAVRLGDDVRPLRYAAELTIDPARPDFSGRIAIAATVARPTRIVWLNATALAVQRASLAGRRARVINGNEGWIGLSLDADLPAGPLTIEVEYTGAIDHERSRGIYAEREGDQTYAYTFFEPTDARRAFPCFDQPNAKVPWRLTFHVPRDHVALANAPVESETAEPGGMKKVVIAESRPLPSYLVAFVVGPFDVIAAGTAGRANTPLRFVVPRGRGDQLGYARRLTPKIVAALEDYFDMDYPYGKLDVAVVPRTWGTMEHPGLLALGQPLALIAPAEETRARREEYARIASHELSHYWFGDLVTMAWWNDTWLNEALGEWMDAITTDRVEPEWRLLDSRRPRRADRAMAADELVSIHPIRLPVESPAAIQASFDDAITYMKGSSVLHMFARWVGDDAWRGFIRAYVRAYAWRNVSAEDFLAVMANELGAPVAAAFRTFLLQPGVPLIEHRLACDGPPRLELRQSRSLPAGTTDPVARAWQVPVCVRYGAGAASHRGCTLVPETGATLPLDGGCPAWLVMNADADGYYRSRYSPAELGAIFGRGAAARTTMNERRMMVSDVAAALVRDHLGIADALALVPRLLADPDERLRNAAGVLTAPLKADALDDDTYERYQRWVLATYGPTARQLGWRRRPGDSDDAQAQRISVLPLVAGAGDRALAAEAGRLARAWLAEPQALADDLVDAVLGAAARDGDPAWFDALLAAARREPDRARQRRLLTVLGQFRDPDLAARARELVLDPALDLRETLVILNRQMSFRQTREPAWRFIQDHVDELVGRLRADDAGGLIWMSAAYCDAGHRRAAAELFTPRAAAIAGAEQILSQMLDTIDRCIAVQGRLAPAAAKFFAEN